MNNKQMTITGFDQKAYLDANPDVGQAIKDRKFKDVQDHLVKLGFHEIEQGNKKFHKDFFPFNEEIYLEIRRDVQKAINQKLFASAFEHFQKAGYKEIMDGKYIWGRVKEKVGGNLSENEVFRTLNLLLNYYVESKNVDGIRNILKQMVHDQGAVTAIYFKKPFTDLSNAGFVKESIDLKLVLAKEIISLTYEKGKNPEIFYQRIAAFVILNKYDEAYSELVSFEESKQGKLKLHFSTLRAYLEIILEKSALKDILGRYQQRELSIRNSQTINVETENFARIIKNKRIAIVGPAPSDLKLGSEIDEFDIIVRSNVTCQKDIDDYSDISGSRVDVVYYTLGSHTVDSFPQMKDHFEFMKNQNIFIVCRQQPQYEYAKSVVNNDLVRTDLTAVKPFSSVHNSMHGIQRMVWDLLRFKPKEIKIFNIDFYVGSKCFANDYYAGFDRSKMNHTMNKLAGPSHCHLSGFQFMKNLYNKKVIDVDDNIKKILSLSDTEYIDKLNIKYGR